MLSKPKTHNLSVCLNSIMAEAVIIQKPNQWTGFYMITAFVMKELNENHVLSFFQLRSSFLPSVHLCKPQDVGRRRLRATREVATTAAMIEHVVIIRHFCLIFLFGLLLILCVVMPYNVGLNCHRIIKSLELLLSFKFLLCLQQALNLW